jgi:hypothetical protein
MEGHLEALAVRRHGLVKADEEFRVGGKTYFLSVGTVGRDSRWHGWADRESRRHMLATARVAWANLPA